MTWGRLFRWSLLVALAPVVLCFRSIDDVLFYAAPSITPYEVLLAFFFATVLTVIELSCLSCLLIALQRTADSMNSLLSFLSVGKITRYSIGALLTCYYLFYILGWVSLCNRGYFLSIYDIALFRFFVQPQILFSASSIYDLFFGMILVSCSIVLAYCHAWQISSLTQLRIRELLRLPLLVGCIVGAALLLKDSVATFYGAERCARAVAIFATAFSPQASLYNLRVLVDTAVLDKAVDQLPLQLAKPYITPYCDEDCKSRQKNVLIIVVEALRSDIIGKKEQKSVTPFLDTIAQQGISFQRAYSISPETEGAQLGLMTGQYPLRTPERDYYKRWQHPYTRLSDLYHDLGFITAYVTSEWESTSRVTRSPRLDLYFDPLQATKSRFASSSNTPKSWASPAEQDKEKLAVLSDWISTSLKTSRKFFASLFLYASHYPYENDPQRISQRFVPVWQGPVNFFSFPNEAMQGMRHRYLNALSYIDTQIQVIFKFLAEKGVIDKTIIVITADHGEMFGEHRLVTHGKALWEEALRVPLIVWGADGWRSRVALDTPVSLIDLPPTLWYLTTGELYGGFQGEHLLVAEDTSTVPFEMHAPVYATVQAFDQEDMVIEWPYKYTENYRGAAPRMFNLERDPREENNLIGNENEIAMCLATLVRRFRMRQFRYYESDWKEGVFPPVHRAERCFLSQED